MNKNITKPHPRGAYKVALVVLLAVFLYRLPKFIVSNFGDITVDQLLFHMTMDVGGTPTSFIRRAVSELLLKPLIACLLVYALLPRLPQLVTRTAGIGLLLFSGLMTAQGLAGTASAINLQESLDAYANPPAGDWATDWYHTPDAQPSKGRARLNLIWIYVESLESKRIPANAPLRKLAQTHFSPRTFQVLPGTQWTLAGMVSSQCGVPLMPVGMFGASNFSQVGHPLESARCIGDILRDTGYHNEFVGGADHAFAGKGNFLKTHGFDQIFGRMELQEHYPTTDFPEDWWGYSDATVLEFARKRLSALKSVDQPFFLNVLTLDTHSPKGILTPRCRDQGFSNQIDDIFKCTILEIEKFVAWLDEEGMTRDTVIVISGDHPFMEPRKSMFDITNQAKQVNSQAQQVPATDIFTLIMTPDQRALHPPVMNHFDFFPTVMSALNLDVDQNRAGLGTSLFSGKSLTDDHDVSDVKRRLRARSEGYLELWRPHEVH